MDWIIVGLGNPGQQYEKTRHNVGFMVVEAMVKDWKIGRLEDWKMEKKFKAEILGINNLLLVKPQTFMNKSGEVVVAAARFYKIPANHVIVVHDDLDITMGVVKAGLGKGPKVHHGIQSVEQNMGTVDFWRIRIGVDARNPAERVRFPGEKYVLMPVNQEDQVVLNKSIEEAVKKVREIIKL